MYSPDLSAECSCDIGAREVADVAIDDAEQRGDGSLVRGDKIKGCTFGDYDPTSLIFQ